MKRFAAILAMTAFFVTSSLMAGSAPGVVGALIGAKAISGKNEEAKPAEQKEEKADASKAKAKSDAKKPAKKIMKKAGKTETKKAVEPAAQPAKK